MNIQNEITTEIMNRCFWEPQITPTFIQEIQLFEEFLESAIRELDDDTLANLELQIKRNSIGYILDGLTFGFIKQTRLYRRKCAKWKDYCESRFNKSVGYCNQLIKTAQTVLQLVRAGFKKLPANEAQARPLTKIEGESVCDKWQEVLDVTTTDYNGVLTASTVNKIVSGQDEPQTKNVKISKATYDKLKELSRENGKSIDEIIDELLGVDAGAGVDEKPELDDAYHERLQRWEKEYLEEYGVKPPTPAPIDRGKDFIDKIKRLASEWKILEGSRPWIKEECVRWGIPIDDEIGPIIPAT
jgi:hypothetical protein